jgi:hypothetical protein
VSFVCSVVGAFGLVCDLNKDLSFNPSARFVAFEKEIDAWLAGLGRHPREVDWNTQAMPDTSPIPSSARWHFQTAMILAVAADALQVFVFPFFAEGALSPADDILDLAVAAALVRLVGWHWEFLPAFAIELVPGVDLVPFWTLAVANVYRKWKQKSVTEDTRDKAPVIEGEYR